MNCEVKIIYLNELTDTFIKRLNLFALHMLYLVILPLTSMTKQFTCQSTNSYSFNLTTLPYAYKLKIKLLNANKFKKYSTISALALCLATFITTQSTSFKFAGLRLTRFIIFLQKNFFRQTNS